MDQSLGPPARHYESGKHERHEPELLEFGHIAGWLKVGRVRSVREQWFEGGWYQRE